jgi:glycosyltransferase 2 family protein
MKAPSAHAVGRFVSGAALLVGSGVAASRGPVQANEERVFRAINDLGDGPSIPFRAVMQAGALGAVPVASLGAVLAARRGLALRLALGGVTAWVGAKLIKRTVRRGRPVALHDMVNLRGAQDDDLGWISGHAAVATTLALIAAPELPGAAPLLAALPLAVGIARIYVGAHEPLDVVGGVGFGMMLAAVLARA